MATPEPSATSEIAYVHIAFWVTVRDKELGLVKAQVHCGASRHGEAYVRDVRLVSYQHWKQGTEENRERADTALRKMGLLSAKLTQRDLHLHRK